MQDRKRRKLQVGQYMINDNLFSTSLKKLNYKPRAKEIDPSLAKWITSVRITAD